MAANLKVIKGGLLPDDQAREDEINRLHSIWTSEILDARIRAQALKQYTKLVGERPAYVIENLERELRLSGSH